MTPGANSGRMKIGNSGMLRRDDGRVKGRDANLAFCWFERGQAWRL